MGVLDIPASLGDPEGVLRGLDPDRRGVLRTPAEDRWRLRRWEPSAALASYVSWYWAVSWELGEETKHEQAVLPHPSAHLVVENGTAGVHGPVRQRFDRTLTGSGWVIGARFRPGGIRPLLREPVAAITDRSLPADTLAGLDGQALVAAIENTADLDAGAQAIQTALAPLLPPRPDPAIALADRAVTLLADDSSLLRVADLADRMDLSIRSLQRLFTNYVGLGAGAVLRRYRLHEVAARALAGHSVDWSDLAAQLGYFDQAHLVRDFTTTIGTPPARYATPPTGPGHTQ